MAQWMEDPQGRPEVEKVTKELKLPVWKANHKGKFRDFWNELWDKIEDYILKLKGDTEKNSKGLNDRLVSAVGKHDGDFPITNAVVGNVYYSELTKKYYKCKVGGPAPMPNGNFIDMSILENLNRLENLYKVTKIDLNISNVTFAYVIKQGNICFLFIDSKQAFYGKKKDDTLFTLPQNVIPSEDIAFSFNSISSNSSAAAKIYKNGQCKLLSSQTLNDAFYISISYTCDNFN